MDLKLSKGYVAIVDDDEPTKPWQHKWSATEHKHAVYAQRVFVNSKGEKEWQTLHRFILGIGRSGVKVDHRDGDGLNNRRKNLRKATTSQNNANAKLRIDNTSGVKGVCWHKNSGLWFVQLSLKGKRVYAKYFHALEDAKEARNKAAKKYHKKFSRD